MYDQPFEDLRHLMEHEIDDNEGVGHDDPFGGMADVTLMPKRCSPPRWSRIHVGAGKAGNSLGSVRITLVWHGGRSLVPRVERLFHLSNFGPLQMADLDRNFSSVPPMPARTANMNAWRSRWTICVDAGATPNPSAPQTSSSSSGGTWACVPTAPEIFPTAISSRARSSRLRWRAGSSYQTASFKPNVVGSACIPCVRPIINVWR